MACTAAWPLRCSMIGERLLERLREGEAGIDVRQPEDRVAKDFFGQLPAVVVAGERVGDRGVAVDDKRARQQMMQQHFDRSAAGPSRARTVPPRCGP